LKRAEIAEQTLLLIKPDGVLRGLCGEILGRLERAGLAIVGLKMVHVTKEQAERHYSPDPDWLGSLGHKTLRSYAAHGRDAVSELGTDDPHAIGRMIRSWLVEYMVAGPTVACALEGPHAVQVVRKLTGETMPLDAAPGTIRGDLATTSAVVSNVLRGAVRNLVHASSSPDEARREIATWFGPDEICGHEPASWQAVYGPRP